MANLFRDLKAEEIECRVSRKVNGGFFLLLYKDARCDMNILDEVLGPFGWQRKHFFLNDRLFCEVGIKDPSTGEWVWKTDVGTESNTEAEKGQSSDSFKRACFNIGIGRELYTAPKIFIPDNGNDVKDDFDVDFVKIVDKKIVGLKIMNTSKGHLAYSYIAHGYRAVKPNEGVNNAG